MSAADNEKLARRFYEEVMVEGKLEAIDELVADDYVEHESFPGLPSGKEAVPAFVSMMREAFPDLEVVIEDVVATDDKVAVRARMTGTHQGEFAGIPATGNRVDVPMIDVVEVRDGQSVAHWGVTDQLTMMQQLGVIPEQ